MLFCLYVFDVCGLFCVSGPSGHGARSASQEVTEAHTVRQFQQRPPVLVVGPRSAISPSPYGVAIGLQATGDLRPRQARLLLEPPQTLREVVGDGMGSSVVANALSRHRAYPPRCTADDSVPCERKRSYPAELNRGRRGPGWCACSPVHPCMPAFPFPSIRPDRRRSVPPGWTASCRPPCRWRPRPRSPS